MKRITLDIAHNDIIAGEVIFSMLKEIGLDEVFLEDSDPLTLSFEVRESKVDSVIDQIAQSMGTLLETIDTEDPIKYNIIYQ